MSDQHEIDDEADDVPGFLEPDVVTTVGQCSLESIYHALGEANGNISAAARNLGVKRNKLAEKIDRTPVLLQLKKNLVANVLDKAEDNMFAAVACGDQKASKFILMTLGKERGYSTQVINTDKEGNAAGGVNIIFEQFTPPAQEEQENGDD